MNTVLTSYAPVTRLTAVDHVDLWRVAPGSHAAVAFDRRSVAVPVAVVGGSFEIDPSGDTALLDVVLASGALQGTARRERVGLHGQTVWTVTGTLALGTRSVPVVIGLRDHGITHRRGTWRWLSGTGGTPRCGRRRRRAAGAPVVLDLLLHA